MTSPRLRNPSSRRRRRQAGFTMIEVMMALVLFVIALVGLVATQSRGIEAQQAAMEMRDAERVAQHVMNELQSQGFDQLASANFQPTPDFPPYADTPGNAGTRLLFDYGAAPVEDRATATRPGTREVFYAAFRRVDPVPATATTAAELDGVALTVQVLWLDTTNPALPPPAIATVEGLDPSMVDPTDTTNYREYVRSVELRTVRINDNGSLPGVVGAPPP